MAKTEHIRPDVDRVPKNALTRTLQDLNTAYRSKLDPAAVPWTVKGLGKEPTRTYKQSKADTRWLQVFPCRRGRKISGVRANIYIHSSLLLGFIGKGNGLRKELLSIPGVISHQAGDEEFSVLFPDSILPLVAEVVKPFAKRRTVKRDPKFEK